MKILTFDLEDWFHILDNHETADPKNWGYFETRVEHITLKLLHFLDHYNAKATFFVLGWIAEKFPELVKEVANRGHEIACHSHHHQLVYRQSSAEFEADLIQATETIERACGIRPYAYRAPGFSITNKTPWAWEILVRNGYKIDCSVFPAMRAHGGLPNFPESGPSEIIVNTNDTIQSFPINFIDTAFCKFVFSGGGYFRILPSFTLPYLFKSDDYIMTYFHPRDFDPDQPMVPGLSMKRRFKSYVGLRSTERKLGTLLEKYKFLTLAEAADEHYTSSRQLPKVYL